jgi:uncharacterized protein YndB with AHSA1/START domain/uncharacterized cupin superfamily protein
MTSDAPLTSARVDRVLPAPPHEVFDAWVDEAALAEFICPAPGTAQVSIDPRVGGRLRIVMAFPDRRSEIDGEYISIDRPHRLSFSWRSSGIPGESVVTVTFAPHGQGETLMRIVHSRLPPARVGRFVDGWGSVGDQLAATLRRAHSIVQPPTSRRSRMTGVTRIDPTDVSARPQVTEGPALTRTASLFEPGAGLTAGVWEAEPFSEHIPSYPCDEVCVLIEGTIHLRLTDGSEHAFGPGEAFAIAQGTECTWRQDDRVRKFYVIRER